MTMPTAMTKAKLKLKKETQHQENNVGNASGKLWVFTSGMELFRHSVESAPENPLSDYTQMYYTIVLYTIV